MFHQAARIVEIIATFASAGSLAYYIVCLWSATDFLLSVKSAADSISESRQPSPVSILKPLKGTDPQMYESFRSHCQLDYSEYEIIFGVSDPADPAIELVHRLKEEFPQHAIRLIVCEKKLGTNTKVSNLVQMLPHARHALLLLNDSDIRVDPDYLRSVFAPLCNPAVGLVTCLYRGIASVSLGSRLESLGISSDFCPGVLVARKLGDLNFGLGSTLAFRRSDLAAIGGFEPLLNYLADDYQLGHRIASLGLKVELSKVVVETHLPAYTFRDFLRHQLRWARTIRDSRFWGYVGIGITFGLLWATIALITSGFASWCWWLWFAVALLRTSVALVVGRGVLCDSQVTRWLALLPLRDLTFALVWIASFVGHTVSWRGDSFRLEHGKLIRITRTN